MQASNVVQINPDRARIDAEIKATGEAATLAERKRCLAINDLSKPGLEGKVQTAIDSGMTVEDFKLWAALPKKEKRPPTNTAAIYETRNKQASAKMNRPKS